ncbi:BnaA01g12620D [Brassica napus]|uniref:BnaA01g12620D protein n=1 Tax=Brassica napus TaxID=3708 RepID=A0A078HTT3_BRANA|nr:BnaA01g12620D [Brassica napus]
MLCSEARRRSYPPPLPMASPPPEDDQARMTNNGNISSDSDILTPQSSQYDFKTIEAAINKFARSNKLVEGGFGEVTLSNGIEVAVKLLSKKSDFGLSTIFAMEQTQSLLILTLSCMFTVVTCLLSMQCKVNTQ